MVLKVYSIITEVHLNIRINNQIVKKILIFVKYLVAICAMCVYMYVFSLFII